MSIVVTGATGNLGRLVIEELLLRRPATEVAAVVRDAARAADLGARGVELRVADYNAPQTLRGAFRPGDVVLLISGSEIGRRVPQHTAVIDAARAAGVARLVYTSMLGCADADFTLMREHHATEQAVIASGLTFTLLRNAFYTEGYTAQIAQQTEHGVVGAAGEGRIGSATRADLAAAAVAAVTQDGHENATYELAGDSAWTFADYAAELSRQTGRTITYTDLSGDAYAQVLTGAGLPAEMVRLLVDVDVTFVARGLAEGGSGDLSRLIGRPSTPLASVMADALA
ncbi:NAD(P)H-binding protein [Streptomyces sp. NPDC058459]|uniref:NAD(P)H-binding protein n=1 Tax=Streptomyces sp. NPDC058459 TaxID=3346508 RepID=UPI00364F97C6